MLRSSIFEELQFFESQSNRFDVKLALYEMKVLSFCSILHWWRINIVNTLADPETNWVFYETATLNSTEIRLTDECVWVCVRGRLVDSKFRWCEHRYTDDRQNGYLLLQLRGSRHCDQDSFGTLFIVCHREQSCLCLNNDVLNMSK